MILIFIKEKVFEEMNNLLKVLRKATQTAKSDRAQPIVVVKEKKRPRSFF